jgi:hypothetical protein
MGYNFNMVGYSRDHTRMYIYPMSWKAEPDYKQRFGYKGIPTVKRRNPTWGNNWVYRRWGCEARIQKKEVIYGG